MTEKDRPLGTDSLYMNRSSLEHPYYNAGVGLQKTSSCFLVREVLTTPTVGIEFMSPTAMVEAIVKGLPNPSLLKQSGNTNYDAIKEVHQLLMSNMVLVESAHSGGQNRHLGIVLLPKQYNRITATTFVLPPNMGRTAIILEWTLPEE